MNRVSDSRLYFCYQVEKFEKPNWMGFYLFYRKSLLYQDTQDTKNHYIPKDEPSLFYLEDEE